jgi:pimeloyl-ACP methyl ester carboxylesterase
MTQRQPEAVAYCVDGLTLRGKWWPGRGQPILALHGWWDNAESFDALALALVDRPLLAIDLFGHGHSDHKPRSGSYSIWDDLRGLVQLCQQLGYPKLTLMGHSRGAIIGTLLASIAPDYFDRLICVDGFVAEPLDESGVVTQLKHYVDDFSRVSRGDKPCPSINKLIAARRRDTLDISAASAEKIIRRNIRKADDGQYYWRSDRRLAWASPLKLSHGQWQAVVDSLKLPVLILAATQGLGPKLAALGLNLHTNIRIENISGGHHCHMDAQMAEHIAALIRASQP